MPREESYTLKSLRLSKSYMEMIDYIQRRTGMTFSEIVRHGIRNEFLKEKSLEKETKIDIPYNSEDAGDF